MANFSKFIVLKLIKVWQHTFSLDHGPFKFLKPYGQCKFYPTCSTYTYQAVEKYGVTKGGFMGIKRIIRCHPWSDGGHDPVN